MKTAKIESLKIEMTDDEANTLVWELIESQPLIKTKHKEGLKIMEKLLDNIKAAGFGKA